MNLLNKNYSGPLGDFLNEIESHRTDAIYNYEYKYIKEIIWDDVKNEKYGITRAGYDKFKNEEPGYMTYSGETIIRTNIDRDGDVLGYMTETKRKINDSLNEIFEIYVRALDRFCELVESSEDTSTLKWWLDKKIHIDTMEANTYLYAVKKLETFLYEYNECPEFKTFIDKVK